MLTSKNKKKRTLKGGFEMLSNLYLKSVKDAIVNSRNEQLKIVTENFIDNKNKISECMKALVKINEYIKKEKNSDSLKEEKKKIEKQIKELVKNGKKLERMKIKEEKIHEGLNKLMDKQFNK